MPTFRRIRKIASALAVGVTVLGAVVFGGQSASAATVTYKSQCSTVIGGLWYYDFLLTMDAPATVSRGQTVTVNIGMELINALPGPRAAHTTGISLDVILGGANTGTATSTVMWNPEIPAGTPLRFQGGTVQFTLPNAGSVTYRPSKFTWGFTEGGAGLCRPRDGFPAPVAATTQVLAGTPAAAADSVSAYWFCSTGFYGWPETFWVTVNAPATARVGDTITVTGSVMGTIERPGPRSAGGYVGRLDLEAGGATAGPVAITGMTSPAASGNDPYGLVGGSGQIALNTAGAVTFAPKRATWAVATNTSYGWTCTNSGNGAVAATTQVLPR